MNLPESHRQRRENLYRGLAACSPENFESLFNAISSVLEWVLCIEQLMNEKKVLGILMKQNLTGKLPDS